LVAVAVALVAVAFTLFAMFVKPHSGNLLASGERARGHRVSLR